MAKAKAEKPAKDLSYRQSPDYVPTKEKLAYGCGAFMDGGGVALMSCVMLKYMEGGLGIAVGRYGTPSPTRSWASFPTIRAANGEGESLICSSAASCSSSGYSFSSCRLRSGASSPPTTRRGSLRGWWSCIFFGTPSPLSQWCHTVRCQAISPPRSRSATTPTRSSWCSTQRRAGLPTCFPFSSLRHSSRTIRAVTAICSCRA